MMKKRTDSNQQAIINALRAMGCSVQDLSQVGRGCPDLLIGHKSKNYLLEVKFCGDRAPKLTECEEKWISLWDGQIGVITSIRDALAIIIEDNGDVNDPT
jgi:hypothetical protein